MSTNGRRVANREGIRLSRAMLKHMRVVTVMWEKPDRNTLVSRICWRVVGENGRSQGGLSVEKGQEEEERGEGREENGQVECG